MKPGRLRRLLNLAAGGEEENGDNLLVFRDPAICSTYAVEAIRLIDHYRFRAAMQDATKAEPLRVADPHQNWSKDYFDPWEPQVPRARGLRRLGRSKGGTDETAATRADAADNEVEAVQDQGFHFSTTTAAPIYAGRPGPDRSSTPSQPRTLMNTVLPPSPDRSLKGAGAALGQWETRTSSSIGLSMSEKIGTADADST